MAFRKVAYPPTAKLIMSMKQPVMEMWVAAAHFSGVRSASELYNMNVVCWQKKAIKLVYKIYVKISCIQSYWLS